MKPKGFHDTKEQQFQDLVERCERIEKMILKLGDEHRHYCQNCNEMIRFSDHSSLQLESGSKLSDLSQEGKPGIIRALTQPSLAVFESQV